MSSVGTNVSMAGLAPSLSVATVLSFGWLICAIVTFVMIVITLYQLFTPFAADRP